MIPDLLSPFSMTASSSSGVVLDDRRLVKKGLSLQIFAMPPCPALVAWSAQRETQPEECHITAIVPHREGRVAHVFTKRHVFTVHMRVAPKNTASLCP